MCIHYTVEFWTANVNPNADVERRALRGILPPGLIGVVTCKRDGRTAEILGQTLRIADHLHHVGVAPVLQRLDRVGRRAHAGRGHIGQQARHRVDQLGARSSYRPQLHGKSRQGYRRSGSSNTADSEEHRHRRTIAAVLTALA